MFSLRKGRGKEAFYLCFLIEEGQRVFCFLSEEGKRNGGYFSIVEREKGKAGFFHVF